MSYCFGITGSILTDLSTSLHNLKYLKLRNIVGLEEQRALSQLVSHARQLVTVDLTDCRDLSDASINDLTTHCPDLTLVVDHCKNLTDGFLHELKNPPLPNLSCLCFNGVPITDEGFFEIEKVGKLTKLELGNTRVTEPS